ncbi:MAG TPA: hypothetical protein VN437_01830, partial [Rectinemataceae bacterium]|nr:hypothetical protein [Rectinemataceae bacterium]
MRGKNTVARNGSGGRLYTSSSHAIVILRTVVVAIIGIAACWLAFSWYEERQLADQKIKYRAELIPYASSLAITLNERISMLNGIEAFVQTSLHDADLRNRFKIFAEGLYAANSGVRAIQV